MNKFKFSPGRHFVKNSVFEMSYYVFSNEIRLDKIEVTEEHRGKGIGGELLRMFIEECPKNISLTCLTTRPISLYQRLGFDFSTVRYLDIDNNENCDVDMLYKVKG